ncbi:MAG: PocR ligand-binding domain-containing protein [Pedobacter sp.]
MKVNILDLIDFEKVDTLLEGFNKTTGFVTAILDLEGNVLSKSGWRHICTEFHRIHPETAKKCTISDTELAGKLAEGEKYHFYKCLNGLVDVSVPIVIKREHIANLFSGQFFFEEPDQMFFKKQVEKYGFDEDNYLKALEDVPVVSKEKVLLTMDFLLNMTQLISETTFQRLEQMELTEAVRASERDLSNSQQIAHLGSWRLDVATNQVTWTEELYRMYGADPVLPPLPYSEHGKLFTPTSWERLSIALAHTMETGVPYELELETVRKDGGNGWMWVRGEAVKDAVGNTTALWGAAQDITERRQAEEFLRQKAEELRSSNVELELFNRAAVGRELRMIELKEEINELCRRLGEPPRYGTDNLEADSVVGADPTRKALR